jgi:hypothetical protein
LGGSSTKTSEIDKAAGGRAAGSSFISIVRGLDRWVCMVGENCCAGRSVRATQAAVRKRAQATEPPQIPWQ